MTTLKLDGENGERCWWCGQTIAQPTRVEFRFRNEPYQTSVCCPEHEQALRASYRYVERNLPGFWIGLAVMAGFLTYSNFSKHPTWWVLAGMFVLGLTMFLFPFTTPQTVEMLGLRKSFRIARFGGILFMAGIAVLSVVLLMQ
jgi:hypothetical protein